MRRRSVQLAEKKFCRVVRGELSKERDLEAAGGGSFKEPWGG
jgi:hypothetical protein